MSMITTKDGVEIFYKDWGHGQPIVFHHGWPLSSDDWDTQMLFFVHHGYRVIVIDRRGLVAQAKCRRAMTWTIMLLTQPQSPSISIFAMPSISVTPPVAAKSPAMSHAMARAGSPRRCWCRPCRRSW